MKPIALIDGCEYRFIETLPSLGTSVPFVLCADTNGDRYICPKDFWICHVSEPEPTAPVHANSTDREKIDYFMSMFRGSENLYAKRYHNLKTGKSGYVPACQNEWKPRLCDKKAHKCTDCPNRAFIPDTENNKGASCRKR